MRPRDTFYAIIDTVDLQFIGTHGSGSRLIYFDPYKPDNPKDIIYFRDADRAQGYLDTLNEPSEQLGLDSIDQGSWQVVEVRLNAFAINKPKMEDGGDA